MSARRLILTPLVIFAALMGALLFSSAPASALVKHEYLSQITGFQEPKAVAIGPNSEVYVADTGSKKIDRFDSAGVPLPFSASNTYIQGAALTGTPSGSFEAPVALAVNDATGDVYVADESSSAVVDVFSASGEYLSQITETPSTAPLNGPFAYKTRALAVDQATGDLYVTTGVAYIGEMVDVFNSANTYVSQIILTGEPNIGGVAIEERTGDVYVAVEGGVGVFDEGGVELASGLSGANTPAELTIGETQVGIDQSNGHVYVPDGSAVYEFGHSYTEDYEGEITSSRSVELTSPSSVAVDPATDYVYVSDRSGAVDIFGPDIAASPMLGKESFSTVSAGSAVLSGRVMAGEAQATYHFDYGTTSAYGSRTPKITAKGTFPVSAQVEGLAPDTEYHFRLVAENEAGVEVSTDEAFTTLPRSSTVEGLPDSRVFEMVTPIDKEDAEIYVPEALYHGQGEGYETTNLTEAAAGGDAVVYQGDPTHSGGGESSGNGLGSAYRAIRSPGGGWTQESIQPPGRRHTFYRGFSEDLSAGVMTSPTENTELAEPQLPGPVAPAGYFSNSQETYKEYSDLYQHTFSQENYYPLFSAMPNRPPGEEPSGVVPDGGDTRPPGPVYAGGVPDMSQLLFQANDALLEGNGVIEKELNEDAAQERIEGQENFDYLYDWDEGRLGLVDLLPNGHVAQNATFGGPHLLGASREGNPPDFSHVISTDGSRVFWSALEGQKPKALYMRENPSQPQSPLDGHGRCTVAADACTIQLDAGLGGEGGGRFWTASADGSKVFFTKGDLYEYEVKDIDSGVLVDLTPGVEVQGVIGTGEDGDYVYYVNSADKLYVLHDGAEGWEAPVPIATLSEEDGTEVQPYPAVGILSQMGGRVGDWVADLGQRTAEVTQDGLGLVFMSNQGLKVQGFPNGYENNGKEEVYVYSAKQNSLVCASCDQSGEAASEGLLPISWSDSYIPTLISEGGDRVFFESDSPLASQDTNGRMDVYEWEREGTGSCGLGKGSRGGCVYLLSGGVNAESSWLLGASVNGSDVFLTTRAELTSDAQDELYKVFDARVNGVRALSPPACTGTGCQGVPASPPTFATPSSVTYGGIGNFPVPASRSVIKGKAKSLTRAQKLSRTIRACRGKPKRKRDSCEKRARVLYAKAGKSGKPSKQSKSSKRSR
jgi:DNA-binding beta-propeller fold protein YncE